MAIMPVCLGEQDAFLPVICLLVCGPGTVAGGSAAG